MVARKMAELGLVSGTSGNVSARLPDGLIAITPMGRRCEEVSDGRRSSRGRRPLFPWTATSNPSSESLLHAAIYEARPDVGGIVHTHAVYSSAAAVAGLAIPPIVDEMVVALGGEVRVSEYAPPASAGGCRACMRGLGDARRRTHPQPRRGGGGRKPGIRAGGVDTDRACRPDIRSLLDSGTSRHVAGRCRGVRSRHIRDEKDRAPRRRRAGLVAADSAPWRTDAWFPYPDSSFAGCTSRAA